MTLAQNNALVTGGSRGIGRAICLELARRGANVAVNYASSADAAEEVAAACRAFGVESFAVQADVADPQACADMVQQVLARFGGLDILVNNAGIIRNKLAVKMDMEDWNVVLDTNLRGAFCCIKAAAPAMMQRGSGRVISLASTAGMTGNVAQANYSASKAGVIGMTKALAKEFARYQITVNAVAPGFIETEMVASLPESFMTKTLSGIPLGYLGKPEDVAKAVAFLASEDARYITGQVLRVDGGQAI